MNRQIAFAARPEGEPTPETFFVREVPVPSPESGQILCRNLLVSVDPYLRLKMYDRESYTPPFEIGESIHGRTVAQVVESATPEFRPGDLVAIQGGWQDYAVVKARHAERVDPAISTPESWLGALGMTGYTAYAGLLSIGQPKAGETVVVSAAAGAVGSIVGQVARQLGCRAVGIAGGPDKCTRVVSEFGLDACVDYHSADFERQLAEACPNGVDVYFDNVGGEVAAAVTRRLNNFARVAICGLISQYNGQNDNDPKALEEYLRLILVRRLMVRGFIVSDLHKNHREFAEVMSGWLREGKVREVFHRYEGFDEIVPAFISMLGGRNFGKSIVRIGEPA